MANNIEVKLIDIASDSVYMEYTDYNCEYISFAHAKNIIDKCERALIRFTTDNSPSAMTFISGLNKREILTDGTGSFLRLK